MTESPPADDDNQKRTAQTQPSTDDSALPASPGELFAEGPTVLFQWAATEGWPVTYVSPNVESILGYSPTELVGENLPYTELIHAADRSRVCDEVAAHRDTTTGRFTHSPYRLVTAEGHSCWVIDHTSIIRADGEITGYRGYLVDITAQKQYKHGLERISEAARGVLDTDSVAATRKMVIETATAFQQPTGAWWLSYHDSSGGLTLSETPDGDTSGSTPLFEPGSNDPWRVYATQTPMTTDTLTADAVTFDGTSYALFPVGEHGVLVVSTDDSTINDRTIHLGTTLTATAEAALDRIVRTQTLQQREATHRDRIATLEHQVQWYKIAQDIYTAVTNRTDSTRVAEIFCQRLTRVDPIDGAWIAEFDPDHDQLYPVVSAGIPDDFLETIPDTVPPTLARTALNDSAPVVAAQITSRVDSPRWRQAALTHGFQSGVGVPLADGDILHGICTVYSRTPDAFSDTAVSILNNTATHVAASITRLNERNTITSDNPTEAVFELRLETDTETVAAALATALDTPVVIKQLSKRAQNSHHVHCLIENEEVTPDTVTTCAADIPQITSISPVATGDTTVYEFTTVNAPLLTKLTEIDAVFRSFTMTDSSAKLALVIPDDQPADILTTHVRQLFPNARLVAKTQSPSDDTLPWVKSLSDDLTETQLDTLKTAYYSGYFDNPREQSGTEIADSLGISQPTFSNRLRRAQRALFLSLWGER